MTIQQRRRLDALLSAACPIHGTSGDGPGLRIDYRDEATPQQRAAADAIASAFDPTDDAAQTAWERGQEPNLRDLLDAADAAVADINAYLAIADAATNVQVRAEVKAIDRRQRAIVRALKRIVQKVWRD